MTATTTTQARNLTPGTRWQSPRSAEWLTVTATRPAGTNLVRIHSEHEDGTIGSTVLTATALRVVAL